MAAPLFLLAVFWDRLELGRRRWLKGRELSFGPLRVHTTNLISGVMFVLLGAVFISYEGTSALSGLYEAYGAEDLAFTAELWTSSFSHTVPGYLLAAVLAVLLAVALALGCRDSYLRKRNRTSKRRPRDREEASR
jgi:hypothetical protein